MTRCQNCGHESHCGNSLKKEVNNAWNKRLGEIVVCKHCLCKLCTK